MQNEDEFAGEDEFVGAVGKRLTEHNINAGTEMVVGIQWWWWHAKTHKKNEYYVE